MRTTEAYLYFKLTYEPKGELKIEFLDEGKDGLLCRSRGPNVWDLLGMSSHILNSCETFCACLSRIGFKIWHFLKNKWT